MSCKNSLDKKNNNKHNFIIGFKYDFIFSSSNSLNIIQFKNSLSLICN